MINERLILGTVQLGKHYGINNSSGKPSREKSLELLKWAYINGIRSYDTADNYGDSASILGEFQKVYPDIKLLTKATLGGRSLSQTVKAAVANICATTVYSFSLHDSKEIHSLVDSEIKSLKDEGVIKRFGVSVYTNEEVAKASQIKEIDIIQLPFNLFDNWNLRSDSILEAKKRGKEIHVRSVFLQGLFFKELKLLPSKLNPLTEELKRIQKISQDYNISIQAMALGYVLSKPIDHVLIGIETIEQLQSNLESANVFMDAELLQLIEEIRIKDSALLNPSNWN